MGKQPKKLDYFDCTQLVRKCLQHMVICRDSKRANNILQMEENGYGMVSIPMEKYIETLSKSVSKQQELINDLWKKGVEFVPMKRTWE